MCGWPESVPDAPLMASEAQRDAHLPNCKKGGKTLGRQKVIDFDKMDDLPIHDIVACIRGGTFASRARAAEDSFVFICRAPAFQGDASASVTAEHAGTSILLLPPRSSRLAQVPSTGLEMFLVGLLESAHAEEELGNYYAMDSSVVFDHFGGNGDEDMQLEEYGDQEE